MLVANIGCDQVSKSIVRGRIGEFDQVSVIDNFFTLYKVENKGAFLSLGSALPESLRFILLSLFPLAVLGFGLGYLFLKKNMNPYTWLGFAFVIGGGMGNLYDRLVHGSVTDFMHMNFGLFQTGIFNMADVSIMTGMGIVILGSFMKRPKKTDMASAQ